MNDDLSELRLDGRVAIVTGAAGDLGRAIAELLRRRGAALCLCDVRETPVQQLAAQLSPDGTLTVAVAGNVTQAQTAKLACDRCLERWGRIDILINAVGVLGRTVPTWQVDDAEWSRVMSVNLESVRRFCAAVVPVMLAFGWGRIVNLASIAGIEGSPGNAAYAASKAAVIAFTKSLARELATTGILINAVAPATFATSMILGGQLDEATLESLRRRIPMRRFGEPVELARLVGYLVSPQMTFSTGAIFDATGGRGI